MIFLVQTFKNLNDTLHLAERAHVGQVQFIAQIKIMTQSDIILYNILLDIMKLHSQKRISIYVRVLADQ